jgi:hypothetical protein
MSASGASQCRQAASEHTLKRRLERARAAKRKRSKSNTNEVAPQPEGEEPPQEMTPQPERAATRAAASAPPTPQEPPAWAKEMMQKVEKLEKEQGTLVREGAPRAESEPLPSAPDSGRMYLERIDTEHLLPVGVVHALLELARQSGRSPEALWTGPITTSTVGKHQAFRVPFQGMPVPVTPQTKEMYDMCGFHAAPWVALVGIAADRLIRGTNWPNVPGSSEVTFWRAAVRWGCKEEWKKESAACAAAVAGSSYCTAGAMVEGTWSSPNQRTTSATAAITTLGLLEAPMTLHYPKEKWRATRGRHVLLSALWVVNEHLFIQASTTRTAGVTSPFEDRA